MQHQTADAFGSVLHLDRDLACLHPLLFVVQRYVRHASRHAVVSCGLMLRGKHHCQPQPHSLLQPCAPNFMLGIVAVLSMRLACGLQCRLCTGPSGLLVKLFPAVSPRPCQHDNEVVDATQNRRQWDALQSNITLTSSTAGCVEWWSQSFTSSWVWGFKVPLEQVSPRPGN